MKLTEVYLRYEYATLGSFLGNWKLVSMECFQALFPFHPLDHLAYMTPLFLLQLLFCHHCCDYLHHFWFLLQAHWLGSKYLLRGPEGNDIHKTNVPNIRIEFRHEVIVISFLNMN